MDSLRPSTLRSGPRRYRKALVASGGVLAVPATGLAAVGVIIATAGVPIVNHLVHPRDSKHTAVAKDLHRASARNALAGPAGTPAPQFAEAPAGGGAKQQSTVAHRGPGRKPARSRPPQRRPGSRTPVSQVHQHSAPRGGSTSPSGGSGSGGTDNSSTSPTYDPHPGGGSSSHPAPVDGGSGSGRPPSSGDGSPAPTQPQASQPQDSQPQSSPPQDSNPKDSKPKHGHG